MMQTHQDTIDVPAMETSRPLSRLWTLVPNPEVP
jgi:hypothetical protein